MTITGSFQLCQNRHLYPISTALRKTPIEVYRMDAAALDQALGPVESLRFLR